MGEIGEAPPEAESAALAILREAYGFLPGVFRAQVLLPHLVEAEVALADAILFQETGPSRIEKESIVLAEAAAEANLYCVALQFQTLTLLGVPKQRLMGLIGSPHQIELPATLESCLSLAWASFACTLAAGLGTSPDFAPPPVPTRRDRATLAYEIYIGKLAATDHAPGSPLFREQFGFVPDLFRLQASVPRVLEAEAKLMAAILSPGDLLAPHQKEMLMLAVTGSNRNQDGTALWGELLRKRGIPLEISDHSPADQALFDFASKLGSSTTDFNTEDVQRLCEHGFTDSHMVEAIATTAFANFLNTLQICLRAEPDCAVPELATATEKSPNLLSSESRPTGECVSVDSDLEILEAVRGGNVDAFEKLIERHSRRVYRTLVGMLGDPEDARDAMQDTFLKAYQHLGNFQARSKFSTWLVSIATNTAIQQLRERRPLESLDESGPDLEESFRPRQVRAWADDPEQLCSQEERRKLVESSVKKLPPKYRVVVVLRDLEQLSTEEAAAALGLEIPTLKTRLLRGRLMLREALAPHFAKPANEVAL
jgi:RNA polymerase sigma-70 factor, ECF subfamily